jgi:hypothetical protein
MDESPFSEIGGQFEKLPRGTIPWCPPISENEENQKSHFLIFVA